MFGLDAAAAGVAPHQEPRAENGAGAGRSVDAAGGLGRGRGADRHRLGLSQARRDKTAGHSLCLGAGAGPGRAWLWVAVSTWVAVFLVRLVVAGRDIQATRRVPSKGHCVKWTPRKNLASV